MARRTKEDAQATRAALLDAAERVFAQHGVARTSLAQVAAEAGVTRGAVYWHFKDKVDLFTAMMGRAVQPLEDGLARLDDGPPGADPVQRLLAALADALRQIARDEQTRRVLTVAHFMVEHTDELGALRAHRIDKHNRHGEIIARVLAAGAQARGIALNPPAPQLGRAVHALVAGLVQDWLLAPHFELEPTALAALRALLAGAGMAPLVADQG